MGAMSSLRGREEKCKVQSETSFKLDLFNLLKLRKLRGSSDGSFRTRDSYNSLENTELVYTTYTANGKKCSHPVSAACKFTTVLQEFEISIQGLSRDKVHTPQC